MRPFEQLCCLITGGGLGINLLSYVQRIGDGYYIDDVKIPSILYYFGWMLVESFLIITIIDLFKELLPGTGIRD
jgi:hypothetical protein